MGMHKTVLFHSLFWLNACAGIEPSPPNHRTSLPHTRRINGCAVLRLRSGPAGDPPGPLQLRRHLGPNGARQAS